MGIGRTRRGDRFRRGDRLVDLGVAKLEHAGALQQARQKEQRVSESGPWRRLVRIDEPRQIDLLGDLADRAARV